MANSRTAPLSDQARMERIGALLARAVGRKCRREELEKARANHAAFSEDSDPIVVFVSTVGEASPKDVRERFDLSRATAFRRLDALVKAGQLTKEGSTRRTVFRAA